MNVARAPRRPPTPAPDRYELYERAAQDPDMQARFLRALHPAPEGTPLTLGEDFCGAGALSRAWVARFGAHGARAICVDHDEEPLARLRADPSPAITIHHADVLKITDPVDILAVLNFSICEWKSRADLVRYLRHARSRLRPRGLLVLDLYGGENAFVMGESDQQLRGPRDRPLRYVWEQRKADPLTGRVVNAMHFFPAGAPPMRDAFVYRWRLWAVPEMRDALADAGFTAVAAYDRLAGAVDGDGRLYPTPVASPDDLDDDFVVYLVATAGGGAGPADEQ